MKNEQKAVFFDIDGTLVDTKSVMPDSAREAVHAAQKNGVLCIINTGRPFRHVVPVIKKTGFDGYACSCGQHLLFQGKTVFRHAASRELSARIADAAARCRIDLFCESEEGVHVLFYKGERGYFTDEMERFRALGVPVHENRGTDFFFDKFCILLYEDSLFAAFEETVCPYYTSTGAEGRLKEYVLNGHTKKNAVETFCALCGIAPENTYAIGDSVNDLPMFAAAAHTAAMRESDTELLEKAEYITAGVHDGGIEKALQHWGLI